MGELAHRFVDGGRRQLRIELGQRRAQIAHQHHIAFARPTQRTGRAEGLLIPGVGTLPIQHLSQMLGKGGLYQAVFAIDVGVGHGVLWLNLWLVFDSLGESLSQINYM